MIDLDISQYQKDQSAVFWLTREKWGEFSNFHRGFPIEVRGFKTIPSTEHLYQALKFPHDPELQEQLLWANNPKECKTIARSRSDIREDWDEVKIPIMYFCVALKTLQHYRFKQVLTQSQGLDIVEFSKRDDFWGAKPTADKNILRGQNVLGKIIMAIRDNFGSNFDLEGNIDDFILLGKEIEIPSFAPQAYTGLP